MKFPACGSAWKIDLGSPEPPHICRGNPRTWFQKFCQNGGGILVIAGKNDVRLRGHGANCFAFCVVRNCGVLIVPSVSKSLREALPPRFVLRRIQNPHWTRWPEPARADGERKKASRAGEIWRPTTPPRAGRRSSDGPDGASDRPASEIHRTPRTPGGSKRPRNP